MPPTPHPERVLPASLDLTGRVALVTGAGSPQGIGFACARALAELGCAVAVTSTTERAHDRAAELADLGVPTAAAAADLREPGHVDALVGTVRDRLGPVTVVVNCAGMAGLAAPLVASADGDIAEVGLDAFQDSLTRNLATAFLVTRAVLPDMRAAGWGRVVMVASVTGVVVAMRHNVAYAAAKAGMVGLTRALALDTAAEGVTVNAVAPGWIATDSQDDAERRHGRATPVGRSARPDEVGSLVAYLCSPGASYVTGQCVVVDCGNSIVEEQGSSGEPS